MKLCPECKRAYENNNTFCVFDGQRLDLNEEFDPLIGIVLDSKYRIDRKIAKGGTGTVYQATHLQLKAQVAVKIIHPNMANDPRHVERFRREALLTMKVRHTNAIAVMDFGMTKVKGPQQVTNSGPLKMALSNIESQSVYVVMELLDGETLDQRLRHRGYFTPQEVNTIMQPVCAALAAAHEHEIIHRDLKPENVFFHKDEGREVVKLVDFGIAKYKGKVEEEENVQLTQAGFVVGTPFYMSPEQCGGFEVDQRSDVYALGVILYQMLTGKLPFDGNKASIVVMKHITDRPKPLYDIRSEIPAVINAVVMHALAKKPEERPQTALELARELDSAVRAVTEQELQKVFLNATEDDLEAALLLTTELGNDAVLSGSTLRRHTSTLEDSAEKLRLQNTQEAVAISDSQSLPVGGGEAMDGLCLEFLQTSKDLTVLLEMICSSLERNSLPDRESFLVLKQSIDQLRGVVFGLQTTYYKN